MHAVGAAHRCSGCVITREVHENRHREIAELVAEYKAEEAPTALTLTPSRIPLLERNVNLNAVERPRPGRAVLQLELDQDEGYAGQRIREDQENIEHEDDITSLSSYAPSSADTLATPTKKLSKAEARAQKKAKKSAKSQNKALRNQSRNLASVTLADVENVAKVLHGDDHDAITSGSAHPLATDRTIEDVINRNLAFVKNIQAHKQYLFRSVAAGRKENKERKRLKKRADSGETTEETVEMEEVVTAIMIKLGIAASVAASSISGSSPTLSSTPNRSTTGVISASRKRANSSLNISSSPMSNKNSPGASKTILVIVVKLRQAIKSDLEKHENEVHARYVRAGGFWRYVGKTVFERMTDVAKELDVSTGEKWDKKRAREEKLVDKVDDDIPAEQEHEDDT
ncbi:hypothetical protein LTR64_003487 [Lithohypha guttulata]|uniref:uncharacterized protein n=1 Tax=Lithohypha guttulata TaxID=1690604 RepID=UPI002DDF4756|nr:hypothetical protein LTR51_000294 [Lithohypha guttulata]